jgi:hypothetical protein
MKTLTHKIWSRLRLENGQTFVEFAFVLPILALLLFGILQFGLTFHNYLSITDATRVGARAAAVKRSDPCTAAEDAIHRTVSPKQSSMIVFEADWCEVEDLDGDGTDDSVTIKISYPYRIGLPGFSLPPGDLTASAAERLE